MVGAAVSNGNGTAREGTTEVSSSGNGGGDPKESAGRGAELASFLSSLFSEGSDCRKAGSSAMLPWQPEL